GSFRTQQRLSVRSARKAILFRQFCLVSGRVIGSGDIRHVVCSIQSKTARVGSGSKYRLDDSRIHYAEAAEKRPAAGSTRKNSKAISGSGPVLTRLSAFRQLAYS